MAEVKHRSLAASTKYGDLLVNQALRSKLAKDIIAPRFSLRLTVLVSWTVPIAFLFAYSIDPSR